MAVLKPFSALRPAPELASQIAALPYDVYNRKEAKEVVKKNSLSFLNIDRAETQFADDFDMYHPDVYQKAHDLLEAMIQAQHFVKEERDIYYIYELEMNNRIQTGLVGCASIDDYQNGTIKRHENTREEKELDRIRHVEALNAQSGPIFLTYRADHMINNVITRVKSRDPLYDFQTDDSVRHTVWQIDQAQEISDIQNACNSIPALYIADGHHRAASAVKTGLNRRSDNGSSHKESDYFLSILFPHDQLQIMDYNRFVQDLNGNDEETFLKLLADSFHIKNCGTETVKPNCKGVFGMYLNHCWYELTAGEQLRSNHPVNGLDVSILQNTVLGPLLGIADPRTDERIAFIGGIRGLAELKKTVDLAPGSVAFALYPTAMEELLAVADAGLLMPPKSTWFEPKLRSGLFIHQL